MVDPLGKSIYFNHLFTEVCKAKPAEQTFTDLLKLDDPNFRKVKREFQHRINKLFVHPQLGDLLDSGDIDFTILDVLEDLVKTYDSGLDASSNFAMNELIPSPLF